MAGASQESDIISALGNIKEVALRPVERRGKFVAYAVYEFRLCPRTFLFYLLVDEATDQAYTVQRSGSLDMHSSGGLLRENTALVVYSKQRRNRFVGSVDQNMVNNSLVPNHDLGFCPLNARQAEAGVYTLMSENEQETAIIRVLRHAAGMKAEFYDNIEVTNKLLVIFAALKIMYNTTSLPGSPMPSNLNSSYGTGLPAICNPPANSSTCILNGLNILGPLTRCFFRLSASDAQGNRYSELIDFQSHNIIVVAVTSRKEQRQFIHIHDVFGTLNFYAVKADSEDATNLYTNNNRILGWISPYSKRLYDADSKVAMRYSECFNPHPRTRWDRHHKTQVFLNNNTRDQVCDIALYDDIGQFHCSLDSCLSVEYKALVLVLLITLAFSTYQLDELFLEPQVRYYPYRNPPPMGPTAAPF